MDTLLLNRANVKLSRMWDDAREVSVDMEKLLVEGTIHPRSSRYFINCLKLVALELSVNAEQYKDFEYYTKTDRDFRDEVIKMIDRSRPATSIGEWTDQAQRFRKLLWGYALSRFDDLFKMMIDYRENGVLIFEGHSPEVGILTNCVEIVFLETVLRQKEISLLEAENPWWKKL